MNAGTDSIVTPSETFVTTTREIVGSVSSPSGMSGSETRRSTTIVTIANPSDAVTIATDCHDHHGNISPATETHVIAKPTLAVTRTAPAQSIRADPRGEGKLSVRCRRITDAKAKGMPR